MLYMCTCRKSLIDIWKLDAHCKCVSKVLQLVCDLIFCVCSFHFQCCIINYILICKLILFFQIFICATFCPFLSLFLLKFLAPDILWNRTANRILSPGSNSAIFLNYGITDFTTWYCCYFQFVLYGQIAFCKYV